MCRRTVSTKNRPLTAQQSSQVGEIPRPVADRAGLLASLARTLLPRRPNPEPVGHACSRSQLSDQHHWCIDQYRPPAGRKTLWQKIARSATAGFGPRRPPPPVSRLLAHVCGVLGQGVTANGPGSPAPGTSPPRSARPAHAFITYSLAVSAVKNWPAAVAEPPKLLGALFGWPKQGAGKERPRPANPPTSPTNG